MKQKRVYVALAALLMGVLILGADCRAQEGVPAHTGVPQDWTQHHIVFSRDGLAKHPDLIYREPRVLFQAIQRWKGSDSTVFRGLETSQLSSTTSSQQRDWNVALGTGRIAPNMYPAKYSFDPSLPPSCSSDYVVFGLATAGTTGGQANLVALNNLYAGTGGLCGASPTVMFAYNTTTVTGGKIVTSPVLSADASKIAFVESTATGGPAIFHVLTWTAGQGAIKTAVAPTMTSLTYSPTANSTSSSPWVDYFSDTAYLGADDGKVYKITGVFRGTPTLAGAPWPITLSKNFHLTPPVLDSVLGMLMVGSANGSLYQINIATGAVASLVVGRSGSTNPGILGPPLVDVTNGTTFVVSSDDGTSGVLVEADTATLTQLAKSQIGLASASGTAVSLYQPAFSNDYYNDPSTGVVRVCGTGTADTTPWQYAFGFSGRVMNTTASFSQQLLPSTTTRCTGWTEFYNPNVNGGTDFFFFGLTSNCTGPATSGCVVARTSDTSLTTANITGGPSGIVVDNYSTAGQASSIYFCGAKVNRAYKLTQNGLQ